MVPKCCAKSTGRGKPQLADMTCYFADTALGTVIVILAFFVFLKSERVRSDVRRAAGKKRAFLVDAELFGQVPRAALYGHTFT